LHVPPTSFVYTVPGKGVVFSFRYLLAVISHAWIAVKPYCGAGHAVFDATAKWRGCVHAASL
jgi:hypothetical protein